MDRAPFTSPSGQLREIPADERLSPYLAFVPDPLPPASEAAAIGAVRALLSEADQALGELIGIGRLLPSPELLVRPSLRQEAVASSAIEGTKATFSDLIAFEAGATPTADSDVVDVVNYTGALYQGLHTVQQGDPIDIDLVRRIHRTLMSHARGESFVTPGEFRTIQNHIGGGREPADGDFVPPPPADVYAGLEALFAYVNRDNTADTPVLVEAAWVHYQFETIHPFLDGNGRVGRVLIPLMIARRRDSQHPLLYLSPYFRRHRARYNDLLFDVSARSAWREWLSFFLQAVVERAQASIALSDGILALGRAWHEQLNGARASQTAHRLTDYVHEMIAVNASQVEAHLAVTGPTAYSAIRTLENAGILREVTGRPRDRLWFATELAALITAE